MLLVEHNVLPLLACSLCVSTATDRAVLADALLSVGCLVTPYPRPSSFFVGGSSASPSDALSLLPSHPLGWLGTWNDVCAAVWAKQQLIARETTEWSRTVAQLTSGHEHLQQALEASWMDLRRAEDALSQQRAQHETEQQQYRASVRAEVASREQALQSHATALETTLRAQQTRLQAVEQLLHAQHAERDALDKQTRELRQRVATAEAHQHHGDRRVAALQVLLLDGEPI